MRQALRPHPTRSPRPPAAVLRLRLRRRYTLLIGLDRLGGPCCASRRYLAISATIWHWAYVHNGGTYHRVRCSHRTTVVYTRALPACLLGVALGLSCLNWSRVRRTAEESGLTFLAPGYWLLATGCLVQAIRRATGRMPTVLAYFLGCYFDYSHRHLHCQLPPLLRSASWASSLPLVPIGDKPDRSSWSAALASGVDHVHCRSARGCDCCASSRRAAYVQPGCQLRF